MGHEKRDKYMGNRRPERETVEQALLQNPKRHAYEIAEDIGITDIMGYDKAVDYVRQVKKSMKKKGQIIKYLLYSSLIYHIKISV